MQRDRHGRVTPSRAADGRPQGRAKQRAFAIAALPEGDDLSELRELLRTAGVAMVGQSVQHRDTPHPNTYLGPGKLEEVKEAAKHADANLIAVDDELSPRQGRNLEEELGLPVIDRTAIILDIFAGHAQSAEGKLQVELAQLEYNLARMRGLWTHLERLGAGRGEGGIGTRGPGESQLETDRRIARRKISLLRRRLKEVGKHRATRRKEREGSSTPTVALAGYTNVGKSTLLNALTGSDVSVENRLFETLDPTTRGFEHEGKRYLVTDTVGFIRRLPTQLVEGFASTLEETLVADLVLHVVDASEDDERLEEMIGAVESVLHEIGADDVPVEVVLNKIDQVDPLGRRRLSNRFPGSLQISATTGEGVDELRARIAKLFADRYEDVRLLLPYEEGGKLAELYALGAPIDEREDSEAGVLVRARLPHREVRRFARYLVADAGESSAAERV